MSIESRLADLFSPHIQDRGREYFRRGAVTNLSVKGDTVRAQVRGTHVYQVELDLLDGVPDGGECSCPYYRDHYEPCKHMWAVVLAYAERHPDAVGGVDEGDGIEFGEAVKIRYGGREVVVHRLKKGDEAKPKEPGWKKRMRELKEAAERLRGEQPRVQPKALKGKVLYLIDPSVMDPASRRLAVRIGTCELKKDGEWGKVKLRRAESLDLSRFGESADRQIVALLKSGAHGYDSYAYGGYGYYGYYNYDVMWLPAELWEEVLPRVCETGRAFLLHDVSDPEDREALAWDGGAAWQFYLEARREEKGGEYVFHGNLRRGEQRMGLEEASLVVNGGLVFARGKVARLDDAGAFAWLQTLRRGGAMRVPAEQKDDLLEEMVQLPALPRLDLPEELSVREAEVAPAPVLKVRASKPGETYAHKLRAELWLDYGGTVVAERADSPVVYDRANRRVIRRDAVAEGVFLQRLDALQFQWAYEYSSNRRELTLAPTKLPAVVRTLVPEGWRVEAEGKLYRTATKVEVQVRSHVDWFELTGRVDFGGGASASIPALLAAIRKGETLIPLDDGGVGMLPEEWVKRYALLATGTAGGESLTFKPNQAGLLDALLASQPEARCDELFERTRRELRSFEGVTPMEPAKSFVGKLRPYQKEALGWFSFLRRFGFGGCLADDMGLGKTVQVLALLEARRVEEGAGVGVRGSGKARGARRKPSLAVVPRSLIFNWVQEAKKFTPALKVLDNSGAGRVREPEKLAEYDLVLSTYGTLLKDAAFLKDVAFDYVILDEAQAVKNASTASAKAVRLLRADHRLALSGTPIQNHLGELWSLFDFLNPGMLGSSAVLAGSALRDPDEETRRLLSQAVRPFILRRTKEQVAKELPARMEQTIYCELEGEQRKLYNELRDHYRKSLLKTVEEKGMNQSKIQILEALLRLRQAALHPGLIDKKRAAHGASKLDMLLPRLEEVTEEGHKALVFSQFMGMLSILRKRLDKEKVVYEYLDGKTKDRQARVDRFQKDAACKLFLISLKAGGLGLNLTAADYVFLLDPWWNPAVEAQAIDRAHRIGQTKQVYACRLIAKDTVEEKVLALQETKRELADAIINAENSLIRRLKRDDLELLLS